MSSAVSVQVNSLIALIRCHQKHLQLNKTQKATKKNSEEKYAAPKVDWPDKNSGIEWTINCYKCICAVYFVGQQAGHSLQLCLSL
jgi:hypothetical protein